MDRINWVVRWIFLLVAGVIFTLTLRPDSLSTTAYIVINQAMFVTLAGFVLLPSPNGTRGVLLNSGAGALLFLLLSQLTLHKTVPAEVLYQVCVVILCLSLLLWSVSHLLAKVFSDKDHHRNWLLMAAGVLTAAPVWLGPVVEISQPGIGILNGIIAMTPLTHFSVAAEYDYLRSVWFYRNTPFGSLPFAYPGLATIAVGYLVLIAFLQVIGWRHARATTASIQIKRYDRNPTRIEEDKS